MIQRKTTKEILGESICELARKKSVDKITIKAIVDNCGFSSATFYRHFHDKYELVAWIFNYKIETLFQDFSKGSKTWRQAIFDMLTILDNNRSFYRNAMKNTDGQNSFILSTNCRCTQLLTETVKQMCEEPLSEEILFDVKFYMLGSAHSIIDWFLNDSPYSIDQMTDYLYCAMPERIKPFLK